MVGSGVGVGLVTDGVAARSSASFGSTEVPLIARVTTSATATPSSTTILRTRRGYPDRCADQRSSIRPNRQTATETAQASRNIATMP